MSLFVEDENKNRWKWIQTDVHDSCKSYSFQSQEEKLGVNPASRQLQDDAQLRRLTKIFDISLLYFPGSRLISWHTHLLRPPYFPVLNSVD